MTTQFDRLMGDLKDDVTALVTDILIELSRGNTDRGFRAKIASFGDGTNQSTFEEDGTLKFEGDATVWRDADITPLSLALGASAPDRIAYNGTSIEVLGFDGVGTMEEVHGGAEYNHESLEGADIQFHVHWSPTTGDAGNVKWQLAYVWVDIDGIATDETVISVTQAASGTAWDKQKVAFPMIDGAGKTIGSQIGFRFFRDPMDAADTYGADAAITFTVGVHYQIDTGGSRQITTK